jgi:hypothetical protein
MTGAVIERLPTGPRARPASGRRKHACQQNAFRVSGSEPRMNTAINFVKSVDDVVAEGQQLVVRGQGMAGVLRLINKGGGSSQSEYSDVRGPPHEADASDLSQEGGSLPFPVCGAIDACAASPTQGCRF